MTDMIGSTSRTCAARIDSRILTHLLLEATDLLEESQVHAAIETPCRATSAALSQSMWRLATTCAWVLQQLNAGWGDGNEAARMQGAAPLSVPSDDEQSEPLRLFLRRVSRLHERACKLHELTSEPQREAVEPRPAPVAETREPAEVISIFRDRPEPAAEVDAASNPVLSAQSRLGWLFSPC